MKKWTLTICFTFWVLSWHGHYSRPGSCGEPAFDKWTGRMIGKGTLRKCREDAWLPMEKHFESEQSARAYIKECPAKICTDIVLEQVTL